MKKPRPQGEGGRDSKRVYARGVKGFFKLVWIKNYNAPFETKSGGVRRLIERRSKSVRSRDPSLLPDVGSSFGGSPGAGSGNRIARANALITKILLTRRACARGRKKTQTAHNRSIETESVMRDDSVGCDGEAAVKRCGRSIGFVSKAPVDRAREVLWPQLKMLVNLHPGLHRDCTLRPAPGTAKIQGGEKKMCR